MKNLTPEMIEKAKAVKSAEELLALAKENNVEMTADEAATYFAQLNPKSGELDDDDLDAVAGGACGYAKDGRRIVDMGGRCHTSFECKNGCGRNVDTITEKCCACGAEWRCYNCISVSFEGGKMYCNNTKMGK